MKIRLTSEYPPGLWEQLSGGDPDPFRDKYLNFEWAPKDPWIFVEDGGEVVCHVGLCRARLQVGGRDVEVGGIGAVLTKPDRWGRGFATAGLKYADDVFLSWGVKFGMLFCNDELLPYYLRLGWSQVEPPVLVEQPGRVLPYPGHVMVRAYGEPWPSGEARVLGLPW